MWMDTKIAAVGRHPFRTAIEILTVQMYGFRLELPNILGIILKNMLYNILFKPKAELSGTVGESEKKKKWRPSRAATPKNFQTFKHIMCATKMCNNMKHVTQDG